MTAQSTMSMTHETPKTIRLEDYRTPAWLVDQLELDFDLQESATTVVATMQLRLNPDRNGVVEPLLLDGEKMELLALLLDGQPLSGADYQLDEESLTINPLAESFALQISGRIDPQNNKALEGLYLSSGNFCTQCEAQGFRRITWYPDRPDVLTTFRVRIAADKKYRCLLSNGNLVESGELPDNRHYAVWEDPFRKPSYLFALVAGDLFCLEDHYTTSSGREVLLQIYVEPRNRDYCAHAMASLKKSMQWDEQVYALEYDLDRYMIVAVDDFNMGAMENKGLNVFNSKYVLAHPETATDSDYLGVESVIGHEYFHNWTGNRVTCRDWFQLSLKEGLTVFRDQEFSADMNSAAVNRIDDVRILRQFQFPEDAGPMAHPVRPSSYLEINNFYTTTVYNKGAEVIRMLQTLLGRERFIAGVQLYLQRHDGQAVTCDDFVAAMEEAGQIDLACFKRWYSQAGTPLVTITQHYDEAAGSLQLTFEQRCDNRTTPQAAFHIPLRLGLLTAQGDEIPLDRLSGAGFDPQTSVFSLVQERQTLTISGLAGRPVLSPLRGFSAPVKLRCDFSDSDLALRMAHDSDPFNRWEAGQQLALKQLLSGVQEAATGQLSELFITAWGEALADESADMSLLTQLLGLPSEQFLADQLDSVDPGRIHQLRSQAWHQLTTAHADLLEQRYRQLARQTESAYSLDPLAVGRRSLKNFCLALLVRHAVGQAQELALQQYHQADNMTDQLAAFAALVDSDSDARVTVIDAFYQQWQQHPLLVDKWFSQQALAQRPQTLAEVTRLLQHPAFSLANPNRARALLGAFSQNLAVFHQADGAGYRLLVEMIATIDADNPQLAARMATPLTRWRRLEGQRQQLMRDQLEQLKQAQLSRDLYEIVSKSLN